MLNSNVLNTYIKISQWLAKEKVQIDNTKILNNNDS